MEALLGWEININLWLQQFSPTFDSPALFLSYIFSPFFMFIFLPLLYWSVNNYFGIRLAYLILLADFFGGAAKAWLGQPRPFQFDSRVKNISGLGESPGFPSKHTINAFLVAGFLAAMVKRWWMYLLAGLIIIVIPLTRLHLGAHFVTDLFGGYLIGAVVLLIYLLGKDKIDSWLSELNPLVKLLVAVVPFALLLFLATDHHSVRNIGALMGIGIGLVIDQQWIKFNSAGGFFERIVRAIVGLALLYGLHYLFSFFVLNDFVYGCKYLLSGLWVTAGAPLLFKTIGLAE